MTPYFHDVAKHVHRSAVHGRRPCLSCPRSLRPAAFWKERIGGSGPGRAWAGAMFR
jgi:hypothetical protein